MFDCLSFLQLCLNFTDVRKGTNVHVAFYWRVYDEKLVLCYFDRILARLSQWQIKWRNVVKRLYHWFLICVNLKYVSKWSMSCPKTNLTWLVLDFILRFYIHLTFMVFSALKKYSNFFENGLILSLSSIVLIFFNPFSRSPELLA